ncbi:ABC-type multidrug transport system, ATPase and permease component [Acetitomaculum ruminis DSM 5522]|uniref:ABC-type multidrug transport system, ATPase and permease component n=1 Tax=Acetitomaculum ruminis DSM 5522 TaxID=1120918 RepID=A0A1I0WFI0_9FIRM|nr:ABC transporter ATP-binding protein [Acetitomaculum ruminis]SFA86706.1 ABC-type multidrug transport system, ATPase and permease component [Acetitomaculum ruminis DSM 5522]
MKIYFELLKYITNVKKEISLKVVLGLGLSLTYLLQAAFMSMIVNAVWMKKDSEYILKYILIVVVLIAIRGAISKWIEGYNKVLSAKIKAKIRRFVIEKAYDLGPGYMNAKRSGDMISMLQDGIENLEPFFVNYIPQLFVVLLTGVFIFLYLVRLDSFSSILLIIAMLFCVFLPMLTMPLIDRHVTDYWKEYSRITSEYIDTIQGITTLKILNAEKERGVFLNNRANAFCRQSIKNTNISLFNSDLMLILTGITSSVAVISDGLRVSNGQVLETTLTAFMFLAVECARPMVALNQYWHGSFLGMSVARDLFNILKSKPSITNIESPKKTGLETGSLDIIIEKMYFEYEKENEVLKDISISIKGGSTVAIVGKSGSGKSTLLNLLMRFYDVKSGVINLNGVNIKDYDIDYLRKNISVVFQDSFLFYDTIRENVRIAKPDASEEDVINACKSANIHDFIMSLPKGYDTWVGERGMTLSGGQRQRISIARAILKNSPVLLLDEATSSVDVHSEEEIQLALNEVMKNRTTIIVAHRLSTVKNADRIYALDKGRLAEEGTHEELLKKDGVYASLIKAQEVLS